MHVFTSVHRLNLQDSTNSAFPVNHNRKSTLTFKEHIWLNKHYQNINSVSVLKDRKCIPPSFLPESDSALDPHQTVLFKCKANGLPLDARLITFGIKREKIAFCSDEGKLFIDLEVFQVVYRLNNWMCKGE